MHIHTVVDARQTRIDADAAWSLLAGAESITTAKGKIVRQWHPQTDDKAEILRQVIGPSGNLRAPTLRVGNTFMVGFNPELYGQGLSPQTTTLVK